MSFHLNPKKIRSIKITLVVVLLFFSLIQMGRSFHSPVFDQSNTSVDQVLYIEHDPIVITSDQEFINMAIAESWPGNGNANDPYVISGYNITNDTQVLISISNTELYFVIEDNFLNGVDKQEYIINFETVINAVVRNNILVNGYHGVRLNNAGFNKFTGNTIVNHTWYGFDLVNGANNNLFAGNTIYEIESTFNLLESPFNEIRDNVLANSSQFGYGIYLYKSNHTIISDNRIENHYYSIFASLSHDLEISNNAISLNGRHAIRLEQGTYYTLNNNTLDNNNGSSIFLSNAGFVNITGNWISNTMSGPIAGTAEAIEIVTGYSLLITDNILRNSFLSGIELRDTVFDFEISGNRLEGNQQGITLRDGTYNGTINNNDIINNQFTGILLNDQGALNPGLHDVFIQNNMIIENRDGIRMIGQTSNITISYNLIQNSTELGIELADQVDMVNVLNNDFIDNMATPDQAADTSSNTNVFNNNYWSDWTTPDANDNGIVDDPYVFDSNSDPAPLTTRNVIAHMLNPPVFLTPVAGDVISINLLITWSAGSDTHGHQLTYSLEYSSNNGSTWSDLVADLTVLEFQWDTSPVPNSDTYKLRLTVSDGEGLSETVESDTFSIQNITTTVQSSTSSVTTTTPTTSPSTTAPGSNANPLPYQGISILLFSLVSLTVANRRDKFR